MQQISPNEQHRLEIERALSAARMGAQQRPQIKPEGDDPHGLAERLWSQR